MQKRFWQWSTRPSQVEIIEPAIACPSPAIRARLDVEVTDEPLRKVFQHAGWIEVGLCHQGEGFIGAADKIFRFYAGDIAVLSQFEAHGLRSRRGTTSRWSSIYLDPAHLLGMEEISCVHRTVLAGPAFPNVMPGDEQPRIVTMLDLLLAEFREERPDRQAVLAGLGRTLLIYLHRLPEAVSCGGGRPPDALHRLSPALKAMGDDWSRDISVEQLARMCHMSTSHFRKLFREAVDVSPLQYRTRIRLHRAAYLLRTTERSILEIAYDVGYASISSFNRHFHRFFHCCPRRWRSYVRQIADREAEGRDATPPPAPEEDSIAPFLPPE